MFHWMKAPRALWALVCVVGLASCGGGGGDSGGGRGPSYALTFSPATLTANLQAGTSATLTVRATATDPATFSSTVYVYVVDPSQVLANTVNLSQVNSTTVAATLYTSASLAQGRYQGAFQIQLCHDAACTRQVAGSPVPLPYDFTVAPAPLSAGAASTTSLTVHHGGSLATTTTVNVRGPDLAWTASTPSSWLIVNNGMGNGPGSFSVGYGTASLPIGTYSASVTVRSSDGQTANVAFSLQVLPTEFLLTSGVPTFSAINGAPIAAQNLSFELNNGVPAPWTASGEAPWMLVSALGGTTPAAITLQPDPSRSVLASGAYISNLVLSSPGIPDRIVTSALNLTRANLSAPNTVLTLGGLKGRDIATPQQTVMSLNTGTGVWPWTMSALPAWLSSPTPAGSLNQAGTTVSLIPNPAGITAGSVSSTVNISATINGDTVTLPLTVNLNTDQRRLLVSDWGVGFASTPTGTVLSRAITVRDNFEGSLPWTAVSDSAWLSVTASGTTGATSTATLVADPSALPSDAISYATVTLSSPTVGVNPAVIRVGLWKSATGRTAPQTFPLRYTNVVADKIRPHVYMHRSTTTIDVYHVYTGALVDTITVGSSTLARMAVSADGARLYVAELNTPAIAVVDLATRTRVATWPLASIPDARQPLLSIRPNGVEVVILSGGRAFLTDGRDLGYPGVSGLITAPSDGRRIYAQDTIGAPTSFNSYDVDYSAISGGVLMVNHRLYARSTDGGSYGRDIAVSPDGTRLYLGAADPYECVQLNTETLRFVDGGLPGLRPVYLNNVEVASDGRVICGSVDYNNNAAVIEVHAANGTLLQTRSFPNYPPSLLNGQMVVSADGMVVVALTEQPQLLFVPIAP